MLDSQFPSFSRLLRLTSLYQQTNSSLLLVNSLNLFFVERNIDSPPTVKKALDDFSWFRHELQQHLESEIIACAKDLSEEAAEHVD